MGETVKQLKLDIAMKCLSIEEKIMKRHSRRLVKKLREKLNSGSIC